MVQKPKKKTYSTITEQKKVVKNKKLIEKSTESSETLINESGSEYFPSTDSGNRKRIDNKKYINIVILWNFSENETYSPVKSKKKKSFIKKKIKLPEEDYTNDSDEEYFETKNYSSSNNF